MAKRSFWEEVRERADKVSDRLDADVLLFNDDLERAWGPDDTVIDLCEDRERRPNVVLVLVTHGGNPHVAYRIARCLQEHYDGFTVYIPGLCKSAGTLITIGAKEIVMAGRGQLGPLDVQIYKPDELWESASGLDVIEALDSLKSKTIASFRSILMDLKVGSRGQITLKTAMEAASELTAGVYSPIYGQIDPNKLGEIGRAMRIAEKYGERLDERYGNLEEGTLQKLLVDYPSHGFVIDRDETIELFKNVRPPEEDEQELSDSLRFLALEPFVGDSDDVYPPQPIIRFISTGLDREEGGAEDEAQDHRGREEGEREAIGPAFGETGEGSAPEASHNGQKEGSFPESQT